MDKNGATKNDQLFESQFGAAQYGADKRYGGVQFHFHHGSEHTVEGKRHDLEMHTVHLATDSDYYKKAAKDASAGAFAAAMGIMFSVDEPSREFSDEEVAVIDNFFESLKWDESNEKK